MAVNLSPVGGAAAQFFDNNGDPLVGGKLYTYAAGTTTPLATYTTSAGNVPHTNPIILDSAGRVPGGQIWLTNSASYKVTIKTSADVLVGSYDGIIDSGVALADALRTDLAASSGSSLVGYLPAGIGAVDTTVEAKLRESVSVLDFYANGVSGVAVDPTGVVDSTLGIQAAINTGAGKILYPEGTYLYSTLNMGVHQTHEAIGSVTLTTSVANENAITVKSLYGNKNKAYRQALFSGAFYLTNTNAANIATCLYFGDTPPASTYTAANLYCDGLTINGFYASHAIGNNAYIIEFDHCNFIASSVGAAGSKGLVVTQVLVNSGGLINYDNCIFQGFESAFSINLGGIEITCNKCSFDVCTQVIENLANDSIYRLTDCRFEWTGNSTQFVLSGNSVGISVFITNPYVLTSSATPSANPAFIACGDAAFVVLRSGAYRTGDGNVAAYCTVNGTGTLIYDPTYTIIGVAPTVFANITGAGILRAFTDSGQFAQTLTAVGGLKLPATSAGQRLGIRWGAISVASPGIAANAVTSIDVTWAGAFTPVVAAFAQVFPSASNDYYGVVAAIPLTGTSHRFAVKNGAVAQGVNGQYMILGIE